MSVSCGSRSNLSSFQPVNFGWVEYWRFLRARGLLFSNLKSRSPEQTMRSKTASSVQRIFRTFFLRERERERESMGSHQGYCSSYMFLFRQSRAGKLNGEEVSDSVHAMPARLHSLYCLLFPCTALKTRAEKTISGRNGLSGGETFSTASRPYQFFRKYPLFIPPPSRKNKKFPEMGMSLSFMRKGRMSSRIPGPA